MGSMSEVCVRACALVCVYRSPRPPPPVVCLIKNKVFVLSVVGTQMEPRFAAGAIGQSCHPGIELSDRRRSCDTGEDSG